MTKAMRNELRACLKKGYTTPTMVLYRGQWVMSAPQWRAWNRLHSEGLAEMQGPGEVDCLSITDAGREALKGGER